MASSAFAQINDRSKSRKVKAVLAGGLVLGLGATITLAVWNDSEFVTGAFGAGHFNVQGSADGTTFADHTPSGAAATLSFSTGFDNLSPGQTVVSPYVLHLDKDTTTGATVSVNSATSSGTAAGDLTYKIVEVATVLDCTPAATGASTIVPAGTALDSVASAVPFILTKSATLGTDPGADVFLCIQVTSSTTLVQGTSAVGIWEFLATSTL
jgi:predicted ribosomally synthesized peptide with SipW-like signal peptide